jgi:hypothetical protein
MRKQVFGTGMALAAFALTACSTGPAQEEATGTSEQALGAYCAYEPRYVSCFETSFDCGHAWQECEQAIERQCFDSCQVGCTNTIISCALAGEDECSCTGSAIKTLRERPQCLPSGSGCIPGGTPCCAGMICDDVGYFCRSIYQPGPPPPRCTPGLDCEPPGGPGTCSQECTWDFDCSADGTSPCIGGCCS